MRSPENVLKEIQFLVNNYDVKHIFFCDDVFTLFKDWLIKFCRGYKKRFNIPFSCNTRAEIVDKEALVELKKAGCNAIRIGVESGSERLKKEVLRRSMTNQQIINAFELAKKVGLATYSFNMVGIPYETKKEYWETIKLNQRIQPTFMQASIFQPYPGADIFKLCPNNKWLSDKALPETYRIRSIMNYPYVSTRTINWRMKLFRFRIFRKYDLLKALMVLLLDLNQNLFFKTRRKIPLSLKKILFKIDILFRKREKNEKKYLIYLKDFWPIIMV